MKRNQVILAALAVTSVFIIYVFGNTIPPKKIQPVAEKHSDDDGHNHAKDDAKIQFSDLLIKAKQRLTAEQSERITKLENSVTRGNVKEQQIHIYHQLARFWKDSLHIFEPYAYYTAEAAKLENSEKTLTFAAQQFLDNLLIEAKPPMQLWLASNAKVLLDNALVLNPNNDSTKIGIGICYMFGNISDNPMQGILPIREIAKNNPDNIYAQYILGLGGKKSGQFDKAIERFEIVAKKTPENIEAILHLAECFDLKGDKQNAIKWYTVVKQKIKNEGAQKELSERIQLLSK